MSGLRHKREERSGAHTAKKHQSRLQMTRAGIKNPSERIDEQATATERYIRRESDGKSVCVWAWECACLRVCLRVQVLHDQSYVMLLPQKLKFISNGSSGRSRAQTYDRREVKVLSRRKAPIKPSTSSLCIRLVLLQSRGSRTRSPKHWNHRTIRQKT